MDGPRLTWYEHYTRHPIWIIRSLGHIVPQLIYGIGNMTNMKANREQNGGQQGEWNKLHVVLGIVRDCTWTKGNYLKRSTARVYCAPSMNIANNAYTFCDHWSPMVPFLMLIESFDLMR